MIATVRYFNYDDAAWTSTSPTTSDTWTDDDTEYYATPDFYITYVTQEIDFDYIQTQIIINRVLAQAILGYFEPILPMVIIIEDQRKTNRQQRFKRSLSYQAIIVMIAICLIFQTPGNLTT